MFFTKNKENNKASVSAPINVKSHCDYIERRIITKIFDSDVGSFQELQLEEIAIQPGGISDQTDRVILRVQIINKRWAQCLRY